MEPEILTPRTGSPVDKLSIGRIVHYVLESGEHRPAIVVRIWGTAPDGSPPDNGCCQLQVFTDSDAEGSYNDALPQVMWATSVLFDADHGPRTWHWPERV